MEVVEFGRHTVRGFSQSAQQNTTQLFLVWECIGQMWYFMYEDSVDKF